MTLKTVGLLLISGLLLACSPGDSGKLPPLRPIGTLSGQAIAGAIGNARVAVYGFGDGRRGALLASTRTDATGAYAIGIRAPSQVVLIEVRGGSYEEEASGITVDLAEGQVLRAVGRYQSGRPLTLMVTPLTHMAVALAEYLVASGMRVEQAVDEANAAVDRFFALNTRTTAPAKTSATGTSLADLTDEALYGFYLAGLSHWTLWAGQQGGASQPHANGNSITLSQILYHDLRSDGLLDGRGYNADATERVPLGFGSVALSDDAYRLAFSLHMLAFALGPENRSGIEAGDLLDAARNMAAQTALVPDDSDAAPLAGGAPLLTLQQLDSIDNEDTLLDLEEFANKVHSGTFMLQVGVGGPLGAKRLTISIVDKDGKEIDEIPQEHTMHGSGKILVIVDTTDYDDGEYTFTVSAEDILGKNTVETFRIRFDKTAPTITLTSPASSNQATAILTGTYSDNIAGLAAIRIDGQAATLFTDGTWQHEVSLVAGINTFSIEVEDQVGNRRSDLTASIYLDESPPIIDSLDRHGQARLSNGDGTTSDPAPLQDSNGSLYFESDDLGLGGTLIERFALDSAGIPYFAFAVSDDTATDVPTASEDIHVRMRYRHNEQVLSDWQPLTPVNGEYLIPLASETLAADWHRAAPTDRHFIDIVATDPAGNQAFAQFDFHTDIYVPAFDIANDNGDPDNHIDDLTADAFTDTAFADRASLNDMAFPSVAYTFRNTTGKAFYLLPADNALHTTEQTVDRLVREHRVHLKATTEWRIGLMTPTDNCPDFDPTNGSWQYPAWVWNWNGSNWVKEEVPASSYGAEEQIFTDLLPPDPAPSSWIDVMDFDNFMEIGFSGNSLTRKTYFYDYKVVSDPTVESSGYVSGWTLRDATSGDILQTCPESRHFQQREIHTYESVTGYPKDVLSTETLQGPTFVTTGYRLMDNDTGTEIHPVDGWYPIPAGHSITIEKTVTTPTLTLHEDDFSTADYTARLRDVSHTWTVDRRLDLTVAHDAGEANIGSMPRRLLQVGDGAASYRISR